MKGGKFEHLPLRSHRREGGSYNADALQDEGQAGEHNITLADGQWEDLGSLGENGNISYIHVRSYLNSRKSGWHLRRQVREGVGGDQKVVYRSDTLERVSSFSSMILGSTKAHSLFTLGL